MGLSFNHRTEDGRDWSACCPSWSYTGFHIFRRLLATAEGFDLDEMQGYYQGAPLDKGRVYGTRSWGEIDTPLKPLLNHGDDRGLLTTAECAQVAPRFRNIVTAWDPDDYRLDYNRRNGLALADCMDTCVRLDAPLEFC